VPGKKSGDGAHRDGRVMVGQREAASAAVFNGGGVAPVVVDVCGGVLKLERDPGVRRRRSIEGKNSSEGRSPEGADGSDARTESGGRKADEADAGSVGKHLWPSGVDG
jgi:hypothetical protein